MTDLSPAAQAVLDAWDAKLNPMVTCLTHDPEREALAAALGALADQVVPEEPLYGGDQRWMFERDARQISRKKLLAIATELRNHQ
jgi:hypothetical protein